MAFEYQNCTTYGHLGRDPIESASIPLFKNPNFWAKQKMENTRKIETVSYGKSFFRSSERIHCHISAVHIPELLRSLVHSHPAADCRGLLPVKPSQGHSSTTHPWKMLIMSSGTAKLALHFHELEIGKAACGCTYPIVWPIFSQITKIQSAVLSHGGKYKLFWLIYVHFYLRSWK